MHKLVRLQKYNYHQYFLSLNPSSHHSNLKCAKRIITHALTVFLPGHKKRKFCVAALGRNFRDFSGDYIKQDLSFKRCM